MTNTETRQALTSAAALWRDLRTAHDCRPGLEGLLLRELLGDSARIQTRLAEIVAMSEEE